MPDPIKHIIDDIILAETGGDPDGGFTNDPTDAGGRTQYGIAERSNPEAWLDDKVTEEEAREIYLRKYVSGPGFDRINDEHLRHLLVDWGVTSGPIIAIKCLQRLVNVEVDGVLGNDTATAANNINSHGLVNRLVIERTKMVGRIVHKNPSQAKFINGWLSRILDFFLIEPI